MNNTFDQSKLLKHVDGDVEFLAETVALFEETCPDLMSRIRAAILARDSDALFGAAHTLQGVLATVFAESAKAAVRALSQMREQPDFALAEQLLGPIESELTRLESALQAMVRQQRSNERPSEP